MERLHSFHGEDRLGQIQRSRRREDLLVDGSRHDPGGQVHRIADHSEGTAEGGANVAREGGAAVDADLYRDRREPIDDRAHRPQHPFLVGPRGRRRTGREDDLAAIAIDIGGKERDTELVRGLLGDCDQRVELVAQRIAPVSAYHLVRSVELHNTLP